MDGAEYVGLDIRIDLCHLSEHFFNLLALALSCVRAGVFQNGNLVLLNVPQNVPFAAVEERPNKIDIFAFHMGYRRKGVKPSLVNHTHHKRFDAIVPIVG